MDALTVQQATIHTRNNKVPIRCKSRIKESVLTDFKVRCKSMTGDAIKEEVPKFLEKRPEIAFCAHSGQSTY